MKRFALLVILLSASSSVDSAKPDVFPIYYDCSANENGFFCAWRKGYAESD